jgi:hypothetical protein
MMRGVHEVTAREAKAPGSIRPARSPSLALPIAAFVLGAAIFAFYFLVYRIRLFPVPVGFDTSWYVWRARYVGEHGLGPLDTAVRPGHALLSSVLGSVTGRSQLELAAILPLVLVSVFALALGAFASAGFGVRRWRWGIAVAIAGTVLGATRFVGENVANLLLLALVVAGLAALARWVGGEPGLGGAVMLFVAAGLVHWTFLAVVGAILALAALMAVPASRRAAAAGVPLIRTEAGTLAASIGATAVLMVMAVVGVLRAPFSTFEIKEDPMRFLPKLREDLSHLLLPLTAPVAAAGATALALGREPPQPSSTNGRPRSLVLRILVAWTAVSVVGIAYGVATKNLPPHRFLMMMVAVPGMVALTAAVWWVGSSVLRATGEHAAARRAGVRAKVAMVLAVGILTLPGAVTWYRHGPGIWLDRVGLQQTETAAAYVHGLPPRTPIVFLIGPLGPAGLISVPLKERNIRVGLPTDREVDTHFFVGEPADLLAGRRTHVSGPIDSETEPYWEDVRRVLPLRPPVLVLQSFGPGQFQSALGMGASVLAPGVALLQGPSPAVPLSEAPLPRPVPRTVRGLLLGGVLLLLLGAAGLGWAAVIFGPRASPEVLWSSAPAAGAAALILAGLVAAESGIRLAGPGGIATYIAVVVGGAVTALVLRRRSPLRDGRDGTAPAG